MLKTGTDDLPVSGEKTREANWVANRVARKPLDGQKPALEQFKNYCTFVR